MPEYEMSGLVVDRLYELQKDGHPNAIPAFGGAAFAYSAVHQPEPDFDAFYDYLEQGARNAGFWGYKDSMEYARIFCNLCLVDPLLIGIR